uniref:Uncharacterized protein n=1 Tax=Oryzias latipes TaxID=8090 RepID=A0A3P9HKL8_ORYLA
MTETRFDASYPMDDLALERFYQLFMENAGPKVKEEEEEEEERREGQPQVPGQDKTGGSNPPRPPNPERGPRPAGMTSDLPGNDRADDLPPLQIKNVVSVVDLGCRLDLGAIGKALWNTQYNPKTYTGLIMRIRKPRTTANIYSTGKMICTAACSIEESRQAARRHARILQKAGFPVRFLNFRVINCVCIVRTFCLNLEGLTRSNPQGFSFEPELNPAVFLRKSPGGFASIHRNGTVIIMGLSSPKACKELLQLMYPVLKVFRQDKWDLLSST